MHVVCPSPKSNKMFSQKKCIFAMANLQNYKRAKIRMDDMISQQFLGYKNLRLVDGTATQAQLQIS